MHRHGGAGEHRRARALDDRRACARRCRCRRARRQQRVDHAPRAPRARRRGRADRRARCRASGRRAGRTIWLRSSRSVSNAPPGPSSNGKPRRTCPDRREACRRRRPARRRTRAPAWRCPPGATTRTSARRSCDGSCCSSSAKVASIAPAAGSRRQRRPSTRGCARSRARRAAAAAPTDPRIDHDRRRTGSSTTFWKPPRCSKTSVNWSSVGRDRPSGSPCTRATAALARSDDRRVERDEALAGRREHAVHGDAHVREPVVLAGVGVRKVGSQNM